MKYLAWFVGILTILVATFYVAAFTSFVTG